MGPLRDPGFLGCSEEKDSALASERKQHQQLFLAVPRSSNRAEGEEEDFTALPPSWGYIPAPGSLSIQ